MSSSRLLNSVQRLASALARVERETAADHGVSVSQLRCLLYLGRVPLEDGARVSELAAEQGLAVSTMTRNLALLERKGWIERHTDHDDRRAVRVRLSAVGSELAATLQQSSIGKLSRAFGAFHPTDQLERAVAIDRVAAALEKI